MKRFFKRALSMMLAALTLCSCLSFLAPEVNAAETPKAGKQCDDYRGWAQDDPRWYNVNMNRSKEYTIYHYGCAIVSYTKLLIQAGVKNTSFTPDKTNDWMRDNNGFTSKTSLLAYWKNMANIDSRVTWAGTSWPTGSAANRKAELMKAIKAGYYIIVGVNGGGHWVVVDNATSLKKGYPVIWDTAKGCSNPAKSNVNRDLFKVYGNIYNFHKYKVTNITYSLQYMANGGSGKMANTKVTYGVEKASSANAFTRTGYAFTGWYVYRTSDKKWYCQNSDGKTGWYTSSTIPSGYKKVLYKDKHHFAYATKKQGDVIRLYAVWSPLYGIKYNAGGGKGSMTGKTAAVSASVTLDTNKFTRSGYTFAGWKLKRSDGKWYYKNASGTYKWYVAGKQAAGYTKAVCKDKATISKLAKAGQILTFYATWKKNATSQTQPASTLAVKNTILPSGKIAAKSAVTISGVVTSNYTISSVTVSVINTKTGKTAFSATAKPNAKSYSFYNLDAKMTFSKLAAGSYVIRITATDSKGTKTLVNQKFTAVNATFSSSSMVYPTGTRTKGKPFQVGGTVTGAVTLKNVELSVYTIDGVKKFSASATPNAKKYNVFNLDSKMTFKSLPAGKYIYRVKVTDVNNVTKYMISTYFTVK